MKQNMQGKCSLLILTIALLSMAGHVTSIHAQGAIKPTEYEVKAAFLHNFAKFVEWPGKANPKTKRTIIFGVLGESPINAALESFKNRPVLCCKPVIKHFKKPEDVTFCHVLFISSADERRLEKILKTLKGSNTLTVGDVKGFAQLGGIINFIIVKNKVRFEINVKAAEEAGLKISSKLLRLARIVQEGA
jgi:hypothetical protein